MHFNNLERKPERESLKRTISTSGGLGLLQYLVLKSLLLYAFIYFSKVIFPYLTRYWKKGTLQSGKGYTCFQIWTI